MLAITFTLAAFAFALSAAAFAAAAKALIAADEAYAVAVQSERDILRRWVSRPDDPV